MNISCLKSKLREAVAKTEKTATNNPSLPILSCILIKAEGSTVILRSTNLDVGIEVSFTGKVIEGGEIAVPAGLLRSVLSTIPGDDNLDIKKEGNDLVISSGLTVSRMRSFETSDFPSLPRTEDPVTFTLDSSDLIQGLKSVVYGTAQTSMKPEFSSVYVYSEGNQLFFVATDSFRLAECSKIVESLPEFDPILIPQKNVTEIIRLLEGNHESIEVSLTKSQLSLTTKQEYITSRLVDAGYPDYRQIIPKEHTTMVTLSKKDFEAGLKMSTLFSDKFNKVNFAIDPKKGTFIITSSNVSVGETNTSVPGTIEGDEISISFNERYVSDVLPVFKGETISIGLTPSRPMVLSEPSERGFMYLVMPVAS